MKCFVVISIMRFFEITFLTLVFLSTVSIKIRSLWTKHLKYKINKYSEAFYINISLQNILL